MHNIRQHIDVIIVRQDIEFLNDYQFLKSDAIRISLRVSRNEYSIRRLERPNSGKLPPPNTLASTANTPGSVIANIPELSPRCNLDLQ